MKEYAPLIIPCVILFIFAFIVSNLCGEVSGIDNMKQQAVQAGHAEWVADQSGRAVFKWKECK
jgi:hypothetical protein